MTKQDYYDCINCTKIITGYPDLAINKRGFNLVSKYNNNSKSTKDDLQIEIIQFYTRQLVELHANDDIISEDVKSNYQDWKNNYTWYADYIINKDFDGFINYALNNPDYKNRMANFYFLHYKIYVPILEEFIKNAKVLVDKINEAIDN
ncbi:hypothetical protein [Psychroserpens sp.]|uniref:hypothetical protein n=1 Tax=Psychroserpens sp. TaxID=2020870 RepID=UPI0039E5626E